MREEIYELAEKNQKLKYKKFLGFKTDKNLGIKYSFYKQQKILLSVLLILVIIGVVTLIKLNIPIAIPIIISCFLAYIVLTLFDSVVEIKVNIKESKIIIKKVFRKYKINFNDIEKIYLVASPNLKGIKSKIRIAYKSKNKSKNLSIETLLLKLKDIKHFINQIEIEELSKKEKNGKFEGECNVDDTIISPLDLTILLLIGIIFLIDFAI